jgi:hypothetical protein
MVFFDYSLLPGNNQDNEQDSNENTNNNAETLSGEQIANGLRNALTQGGNVANNPYSVFSRDQINEILIMISNERERRENFLRTLSANIGIFTENKQSISISKNSVIFDLLDLENTTVKYNKVLNDEGIIISINNIRLEFDTLISLRNRYSSTYGFFFNLLAAVKNVNKNNKIKILMEANSNDNRIINTFEFGFNSLASSTILDLNSELTLNIPNNAEFTKNIYVYEVNSIEEVIGEAKISFGNRKLNINTNPLF